MPILSLPLKVSSCVKEIICARGMQPGDILPSYTELVRDLAVSYVTVKRGLDDLENEGVIQRIPSRGTFVTRAIKQVPRSMKHIGVIYPMDRHLLFHQQYLADIMTGITQDAPPFSDMHIFSLREDGMVHAAQINEWAIDGVILLGVENDDYLRTFTKWGTPGVVVDYCSQAAPLDYVACDNAAAVRQMAAHLAALGHRCVVYLAGHPQALERIPVGNLPDTFLERDSSDRRERHSAGLRALRECNILTEDWTLPQVNATWISAAADELRRRARTPGCPTAVLTDNNDIAVRLMAELANRGMRVPEDVSVCAVASVGDTAIGERRLTCCRFDFVGMGRKAIALLTERHQTRWLKEPREHRIGFEFVEGQTTGPVIPP